MSEQTVVGEYSMSLRDYIAIETLKRLLPKGDPNEQIDPNGGQAWLSRWCYAMADAMLAAREAK